MMVSTIIVRPKTMQRARETSTKYRDVCWDIYYPGTSGTGCSDNMTHNFDTPLQRHKKKAKQNKNHSATTDKNSEQGR